MRETLLMIENGFQAFGPTIVSLALGGATLRLTSYFGNSQKHLAEEKLKRDLYERRFKVWQNTQQLLLLILNHASTPDIGEFTLKINDCFMSIQEAEFIIQDDDLLNILNRFRDRAVKALKHTLEVRRTLHADPELLPELHTAKEDLKEVSSDVTGAFRRVISISDLT